MSKPAYTLVAYRPNGIDTCRGCTMGESNSAFALHDDLKTADQVAKQWADYLMQDAESGREYCSWEVTLLVNGTSWWDDEPSGAISTRATEIFRENLRVKKARQQEEKERKALDAKAAADKATRERDLAELARLKAVYGDAA